MFTVCKKCAVIPQYARGDPRNEALVLHEDGWAPHSTSSKHSIAAISVTHACMSNLERSKGDNSRVYSFIPVDQLPKGAPHKFDCFFEPLFDELEDLFINGRQVFFKSPGDGFSPANDTRLKSSSLVENSRYESPC